jgi:SAM-dependent methyltransferase
MPNEVFGFAYAQAYDVVYQDKDYASECHVLRGVFESHARHHVRRVLDLGCGTGGHALVLAGNGFEVTGVDRSPAMLAEAARKARTAGVGVSWVASDIRRLELRRRFDAAVMMFAVLGYQVGDADVRATLASARRHLEPGGILAFDVWHGPTVVAERPSERRRTFERGNVRVERASRGVLDVERATCRVDITLRQLKEGGGSGGELTEHHEMRYFFPEELERFTADTGFELVALTGFPNPALPPGAAGWSALGVARARDR